MRRLAFLLALAFALPALAQKEVFFGNGKAPLFKEQDLDRRFKKSKLGRMLYEGTDNPACVQLIGGLLTALAEAGPYFHKRDETFTLDPTLVEAVNTQLSTGSFPASSYLLAMVRKVLIDGRLPDEWMETAKAINPTVRIIDLGKLKMMNEGIKPIDSFLFSLPAFKSRYIEEVVQANSAVTTDVAASFRDTYLSRNVAWGGALLVDAGLKKKQKGKKLDPTQLEEIVAILEWLPPDPSQKEVMFFQKLEKPPPIKIFARLAAKQYLDLERLPRGKRLIIKGLLWEMNQTVTEVEIHDALLFEDRDWNQGVLLGDPNAIADCPAAINDLTGVAPVQPGGFHH